ncbi:MAG: S-adenosylmethionine:tRNA ribosyltransferase-isomerase, partial [Bacteroidetes bacterium]|nr:S-adenosylmethionine:tRNA ribosyltransferase-isomerase [Bacteroidota bacterium]
MNSNTFADRLSLDEFYYDLPNNSIAQYPNKERSNSKLLVFNRDTNNITHTVFNNIYNYLPDNSLLVRNSTKVIPARFFMKKPTGGIIELLCISPISPSHDPQITIGAINKCSWECIVGGHHVKEGLILSLQDNSNDFLNKTDFKAKILSRKENKAIVEFVWQGDSPFQKILENAGKIPLPPYIKREAENIDKTRYQTIYANIAGSVAAPTAGLHFSEEVLNNLSKKNIKISNVILHVGPGTFVPITTSIQEHNMHFEQIYIDKFTLNTLLEEYKKSNPFVIATGTTSLRTLETLYWLGIKSLNNEFELVDNNVILEQNYPYSANVDNVSPYEALSSLLQQIEKRNIDNLECHTQLFITPGYKIKTIKALITNFHLPKSTLLLLVSAFIGINNWKHIYKEALDNDY